MAQVLRMCAVCRTRSPKASLSRWTLGPNGYERDNSGKRAGRGIYTDSQECAERLSKRGKKR